MSDQSRTEAELLEEITRLRRRTFELEQYHAVVEDLPGLLCRFLPDGEIVFVNDAYCEYFGKTREELVGHKFTSLIPEEDRQAVLDRILSLTVDSPSMTHEHRVVAPDGQVRWQRWTNRALFDDQGRAVLFQSFGEDISQYKRTQDALNESEAKYRTLVEQLPAITYIAALNEASTTLYISPQIENLIGFTSEEYKADPDLWRERLHPDDRERVLKAVIDSHAGKKPLVQEYRMIGKDERIVWFRDEGVIVKDQNDQPLFLQGVMYDITDRKKAEKELRDSKDLLEKTFCSLDSAIFILDFEKPPHVIDCNPAALSIFGYTKGEILGRTTDFLHVNEQTLREFQQELYRAVETQGHLSSFEFRMKRKNGQTFPTEHSVSSLQNDEGARIGWISVVQDITERKKAEQRLRESELRYRTLFETLPSGVGLATSDGRIIDANTTMLRMMGRPLEEARQVNIRDTYSDPEIRTRLLKQLEHQDSIRDFEVELKRKDGTPYWASLNIAVVKISDETLLLTVATDVTERNRVEQALAESEEKYRTLVESAGEAIVTVDENGVFLFANRKAGKDLGTEPEEIVGRTMWDLFPKEIADRQAAAMREVIRTGQLRNTTSLVDLQGQSRWYNTTIVPLRYSQGKVTAAMAIARDVHELRQAEERIRTLSSAVEQSIDGVAIGDAESRVLYVNEAFAHMHGYTRQEMVGMKAADLYARNQMERYEATFAQIRKEGSYTGEMRHIRKDGTDFPCYVSITLMKNEPGEVTGTVAVCRDMTESKRREEELSKFRSQMARAEQLASLGTLSATVAHQITQPLTVIRLSLDNVLDELMANSCSSTAIRRLQDSIGQVSNITAIINRFRHFARQSSDTRFGEVNLNVVADRVVRLLEESARQARVVLHLKIAENLPPVSMNETDLEQLFFALIENAIQASDGTKAREVVISGDVRNKQIELRFCDDCGGIAPENLQRLFEPFFTTKPRGQGTGLGLCIVHDVVTRAGGHVRAESEWGKGATFFVTLPAKKDVKS